VFTPSSENNLLIGQVRNSDLFLSPGFIKKKRSVRKQQRQAKIRASED
jgi:hypothetical protein